MLESWLVVGTGRCGLHLARSMATAGVPLQGIVAHSPAGRLRAQDLLPNVAVSMLGEPRPASEGVLVAVRDDAVGEVARMLVGDVVPRVAVHTSGALPGAALAAIGGDVHLGSLHPLTSFPHPSAPPVRLKGVAAAIEGDRVAVAAAEALAQRLGMRAWRIDVANKPRYHAAAAVAGNLLHVLTALARDLMVDAGLPREQAEVALSSLIHASVAAALRAEGLENLTGPLARGDAETVRRHLAVLPPELASAYRILGRIAVPRLTSLATSDRQKVLKVLETLTAYRGCDSVTPDGA
jgi:predicted short-subunit dehydrogenase-like oxidoreductase (DUF2520 family)